MRRIPGLAPEIGDLPGPRLLAHPTGDGAVAPLGPLGLFAVGGGAIAQVAASGFKNSWVVSTKSTRPNFAHGLSVSFNPLQQNPRGPLPQFGPCCACGLDELAGAQLPPVRREGDDLPLSLHLACATAAVARAPLHPRRHLAQGLQESYIFDFLSTNKLVHWSGR